MEKKEQQSNKNSLYILWLPKYFDEYYVINGNRIEERPFLKNLNTFLQNNEHIQKCQVEIYDKKIPEKIEVDPSTLTHFYNEKNSVGYWGRIRFESKISQLKGEVTFSEFGFYYFEFSKQSEENHPEIESIIQAFFAKQYGYPLLTETQEDILKETFLNDHLDYRAFNRKTHIKIRIEDFVLEAYYKADENDIDVAGKNIQNKLSKLTEYKYAVKRDEHYDFSVLEESSKQLTTLKEGIISFFKHHNQESVDSNMYKKIILDAYEEMAISKFLTMVVSAKYFDRITKSIKEVREGLTGKIIYMTPEDTSAIDNRFQNNEVFRRWSEEKIENYVQLLISKKPLFTKIDNALKTAYYVTIGNVSSLGNINDKEDISQLMYYHEWQSLLAYFSETTQSLNNILNLYHSNRTYGELEEIKHYESNNHDKEDIELLIKSNENKLGTTEDSRTIMMMMAIVATAMMALPDMVGSIGQFPERWGSFIQLIIAIVFYLFLILGAISFVGDDFKKLFSVIQNNKKDKRKQKELQYTKSSPDDFDILEHRSNMPIRTFAKLANKKTYKKIFISYEEHMSTHRFVRHIEKLDIQICESEEHNHFRVLPEIVTNEGLKSRNEKLYDHIKTYRTTKFSVNRIDKAKMKVSMRYRVNRIKIMDFLDYYANDDSYIKFYKNYCQDKNKNSYCNNCKKINSQEVIKDLKKDFEGLDAELSFVAIYAFSLISKTLDHAHKKNFDLYKDSFRLYFHIDKYPKDYYRKKFTLREVEGREKPMILEPYDPLSEMVYLVFLGRLKGFNYEENLV